MSEKNNSEKSSLVDAVLAASVKALIPFAAIGAGLLVRKLYQKLFGAADSNK
jgi:hypothetical protein